MPKINRVSDTIAAINRRGVCLVTKDEVSARVSRSQVWILGTARIGDGSAAPSGYVATTARDAMEHIGYILGAGDHAPRTLRGQLKRYGVCHTLTGYTLTLRRVPIGEILA